MTPSLRDLPGERFDFNQSPTDLMQQAVGLPRGTILRQTGPVIAHGRAVPKDFPARARKRDFEKLPLVPIHATEPHGEPTDALVDEALQCLMDESELRQLNISTQANLLAYAQNLTTFAAGQPAYCYDSEVADILYRHA